MTVNLQYGEVVCDSTTNI